MVSSYQKKIEKQIKKKQPTAKNADWVNSEMEKLKNKIISNIETKKDRKEIQEDFKKIVKLRAELSSINIKEKENELTDKKEIDNYVKKEMQEYREDCTELAVAIDKLLEE